MSKLVSIIAAAWLGSVLLQGESIAETKLKAQLVELQAQHEADAKEKAKLAVKLAVLQAGARSQSYTIADTTKTVDEAREESAQAARKAADALENLRLLAESNAALARKAEAEAKTERAKTEGVLIAAKADGIKSLTWQAFQFAGLVSVPFISYWIAKKTRAEARLTSSVVLQKLADVHASTASTAVALEDTRQTMRQLETNTNNKMDQLLFTTSEAEYARGLKQGSKDAEKA